MLNLQQLIDEAKCDETVRELRWPAGVRCAHCDSRQVTQQGWDTTQPHRQKYRCQGCGRAFDALTGTVFAGHHPPRRTWMLCLYRMGLNLSNQQSARELSIITAMGFSRTFAAGDANPITLPRQGGCKTRTRSKSS